MTKKSKIYIKPSKRGTFTAAAKRRGKGVQEFASQVSANPGNYSSSMQKKATFAKNAASWKHEDGGQLPMYNNGGMYGIQGGTDYGIQGGPSSSYQAIAGAQPQQVQGGGTQGLGKAGPIGGIISGITGIATSITDPIKAKARETDATGEFKDQGAAVRADMAQSFMNPYGQLKETLSDPSISGGRKVMEGALAVSGLGALTSKRRVAQQERAAQQAVTEQKYANYAASSINQSSNPYTPTYAYGGQVGSPNAEIEGGEMVQTPNGEMPNAIQGGGMQQQSGNMFEAQGASHAQGGIDTELPNGTRIFSDKLKKGDMTYADHAAPMSKKLGKYEEMMNNPKSTQIEKNTAKRMMSKLNGQLDGLFNEQEASKPVVDNSQKFENGGISLKGGTNYQYGDQDQFAAGTNPYATTQSTIQPELYNTEDFSGELEQSTQDPNFFQRAGQKLKGLDYGNIGYKAAQAAPALYNIGRGLFEDTKQYDPIYNPYEASALNELKQRKYNMEPELEQNRLSAATSRRNLRTTAPSVGAYRANLAAIQAAEGRAMGETQARAQNIQNQYRADYAGALGQYGQQRAGAQALAQQQTERARAAKEQLLQTGLGQLSQFGQRQYTDKMRFGALDDALARYDYDTKNKRFRLK